jgi:hypothetical protein
LEILAVSSGGRVASSQRVPVLQLARYGNGTLRRHSAQTAHRTPKSLRTPTGRPIERRHALLYHNPDGMGYEFLKTDPLANRHQWVRTRPQRRLRVDERAIDRHIATDRLLFVPVARADRRFLLSPFVQ